MCAAAKQSSLLPIFCPNLQESADMEAPQGGGLRRRRTIKKKRRVSCCGSFTETSRDTIIANCGRLCVFFLSLFSLLNPSFLVCFLRLLHSESRKLFPKYPNLIWHLRYLLTPSSCSWVTHFLTAAASLQRNYVLISSPMSIFFLNIWLLERLVKSLE